MAKIPEETLTEIKTQTDLVALIQSRGVSLKQQGANWAGFCPFHEDEKTPNLVVTPGKGLWRCMATGCGKSGNAIQFVEAFDGVSFRHACELLSNGGVVAFTQSNHAKHSTIRKLPCPLDEGATDAELMRQVVEFYHERLTQTPVALEYLESRGLNDEGLLKRFQVGVADRLLGLRLPQKNRRAGDVLRTRLMELGVYRKSGHEHLNGCVVVPIYDSGGSCIRQLYGRRLDAKAPKEKRHLYLSGKLAGIFNPDALKSRDVILCESILDAMTFVRHGMESATCTFGTANFTDEIFDAIREAKVESVRLGFDADEAGDAAAERAAERLQSIGVECYRVRLPWGSDANSFAVEQGGEALKRAVRSAAWLGAGKVAKGRNVPKSPEESPSNTSTSSSSLAANSLAAKAENGSEKKEKVVLAKGSPDAPERPELPKQEKRQPAKSAEVVPVRRGEFWELGIGERMYRVGGLERNNTLDVLKMTLRILEPGGLFHLDAIDLVKNADRRKFIDHASSETGLTKDLIKRDLGKLLLACEQLQEERLADDSDEPESVTLTEAETREALELLRDPALVNRLADSFDQAGIVGEETNVLAAYLACTSRLVDRPLAVIIQSTSAAGKTTLMEAVLSFFPHEDQVKYSAMTGQSLYYLGEKNLKHRILAIVEEEGAEKASYALKLLQSEGELTIASTGKDPNTGQMQTQDYHVEGPVSILLTTTSIDIDEELMNRCLILTVDESREQTERIHALQRQARTLEGLRLKKKRSAILTLLQNAQRLLRPVDIINPWASELTFTSERTRTRRDHEKYLTLIEAVTLLHQHQRDLETDEIAGPHIKTTFQDIEIANKLAPEVLGRSLDELPPQTRRFLEAIKALVVDWLDEHDEDDQRKALFTRRDIRERIGWGVTQTRIHLDRLQELEYVVARHGRNGSMYVYELMIDAQEAEGVSMAGLIDVENLKRRHHYGDNLTEKSDT